MRIAFVAPLVTAIREPQLGGSQALLSDIATGLVHRGHDVSVFAASGSAIDGAHVVDTGIDPQTLSATMFRVGEAGITQPETGRAFAHVYELVRGEAFDVVHNHAFDAPAIELADVDAPVVHTLHLPPQAAITEALERVLGRVTVATVSEWNARAWGDVIDAVLPNGVPVDRIPSSIEPGEGALFAGRISPEKGVKEAIKIAREADVALTVVGPRYDEAYAADIDAEVNIVDPVPRTELWTLMARSAAVLCPAAWDEPFGLVAAEAQAAGTPVVAFRRGALPEVVVDGVTGALVNNVRAGADALSVIDIYNRKCCRTHAERNLSLERTLDAHEELYERIA